jgi:hypothetical protein
MEDEIKIVESQAIEVFEAQQRIEYDIQVATAQKFPRLKDSQIVEECIDLINMDKTGEIAASCSYAVPRNGKTITGPSIHLARIIAQKYGNLRTAARIKQILPNEKIVVSEAICFDLQRNYSSTIEVRKSIADKNGAIYSNDMRVVAGNAANSIALRNAIFNIIPRQITDAILKAANDKILEGVKNEVELAKMRKTIIDSFNNKYKVTEDKLLKAIGLTKLDQITKDHIPTLRSMFQSLKDGDSTVDEMFNQVKKAGPTESDKVKKTFTKKDDTPGNNNTPTQVVESKPVDQKTNQEQPKKEQEDITGKKPTPEKTGENRLF